MEGDPVSLRRMVGNLVDNALKYGHRARIALAAEGDGYRLDVDDDGPGIAPEQRAAVLQRGVRLDESTPGSGLGLAIVVELAALYGGALTLDTSDSGGLRARLSLPAAT